MVQAQGRVLPDTAQVMGRGRGLRAMAPGLAHARRAAAGGTAPALPGVAVMEVVTEAAMEAVMGDAHPAGADMGAVAPAGRIADANGRRRLPGLPLYRHSRAI